jgi:hypothetical protein
MNLIEIYAKRSRKSFNKCVLTATNDVKYLYQKLGFKEVKTKIQSWQLKYFIKFSERDFKIFIFSVL